MESEISFNGKLTCSIGVKDHKASAQWYQDVLSCKVMWEMDEMGMTYMSTPVGDVNFDISQVEEVRPGETSALVFGVTSVDEARANAESKGVRFDGPTRSFGGIVKLATFFDPDGNTFMFYERLQTGEQQ